MRSKRPLIRLKNPLIPTFPLIYCFFSAQIPLKNPLIPIIPLISCISFPLKFRSFLAFLIPLNFRSFLAFFIPLKFRSFLAFFIQLKFRSFLAFFFCSNSAHFLHFLFRSNSAHYLHFFPLKFRSFRSKKCKGFERILLNCPIKFRSFLAFFFRSFLGPGNLTTWVVPMF